jgi:hypothetical protein
MHSRRRFIGQAAPPVSTDILTALILKDGSPLSGVPVEVMFQSGDGANGVTDALGKFSTPYNMVQTGQAVVRITPPEGVEDIGEGAAQGADLQKGSVSVQFNLIGVSVGSPLVGLGIAGVLYALVSGAL